MNQIEKKFLDMEKKIENNNSEIEKKLTIKSINEKLKNSESGVIKPTTSYAVSVRKNLAESILGKIISDAKNSERVESTERLKRERNIIVYGAYDSYNDEGNPTETQDQDTEFIKNLFIIIGVTATPQSITRLGKPDLERTRPLKLVMATTENKEQVMKRLVNLKYAPDTYRKICVRDDLTIEERNLIKAWQKTAGEQNEAENTDVYKVRGTPKNGLRLVKLTKRSKQTPTVQEHEQNREDGKPTKKAYQHK